MTTNIHLINKTYTAPSGICPGWGVFAAEHISAGHVVEECVAIPFKAPQRVLVNHRLAWDKKLEGDAVGTGNAMLYNHSESPNCVMSRDFDAYLLRIFAAVPIVKDQELFIKYQCPIWW